MSKQDRPATIRAALQWAALYLKAHGVDQARTDAELLLAHCLPLPKIELYLEPQRSLTAEQQSLYRELIERRALRQPLQYITGVQEFMSLEFRVSKDVLIPRPDTEVLVETALTWARTQAPPLRLLDLCTGSGAVAVSLGHYLSAAEIWAGDISEGALEIARANASRHGVKAHFLQGDLVRPFLAHAPFHLVTANPPYIPSGDIPGLEPEVSLAEPRMALDGGSDGLDFYRRLGVEVPSLLCPGGKLIVEIGWDQANAVRAILSTAGFEAIEVVRDYAGRDRVVAARILA